MATNPQLEHYRSKLAFEIDAWDLQAAQEAGEAIVVIDVRSPEAFARGHILGAVNLPHRSMNAETTRFLDRSALAVTYCDGVGCNASTKGALKLAELGFCVKELTGGLDWWRRDGHPTGEDCGCG